MQIEERAAGEVTILDLKGKMTLGEGDEILKDKINSLVLQGRKQLVLNLADVPYIDSAGLGEVVRTYTTVKRQGGSLRLLNLTKRIEDLLAITKLLTVFETYDNEADAVRSFTVSQVVRHRSRAAPVASRSGRRDLLACASARSSRSLRPQQWTKNLFVLPDCSSADTCWTPAWPPAAAAFLIFCGLSGAVYLVNDVARPRPPTPSIRSSAPPIASGALSPRRRAGGGPRARRGVPGGRRR